MMVKKVGVCVRMVLASTALGALFLAAACGGDRPAPRAVSLTEVLDCTGAEEAQAIFPVRRQAQSDAGGEVISLGLGPGNYASGGPDAGPAFDDTQARRRAALVCACRARRNRASADTASTAGDVLTVVGGVGTVGGGAVNGVAATDVDSTTRKTLLTTGIITMGVGALAFGANAALALNKRATTLESTANDQEYAAAVLWNDAAGEDQWSRAWSACVTAEGSEKTTRLDNPAAAFASDAGTPKSGDAGGASDGGGDGGKSTTLNELRGTPSTTVEAGAPK